MLPERYAVTQQYMDLRAAERWGRDPGWMDRLPPGRARLLRMYERIRQEEEARRG